MRATDAPACAVSNHSLRYNRACKFVLCRPTASLAANDAKPTPARSVTHRRAPSFATPGTQALSCYPPPIFGPCADPVRPCHQAGPLPHDVKVAMRAQPDMPQRRHGTGMAPGAAEAPARQLELRPALFARACASAATR